MAEYLDVCGYNDSPISVPEQSSCDSCGWIEERVENLEECCSKHTDDIASLQNQIDHIQDGDKHFAFSQSSPASIWYIEHNLNKFPSVTIVDSAGNQVEGDVAYIDINNVMIMFYAAFSGKAYLN